MTAGSAPTVPASPPPLAPNRLVFVGTGLLLIPIVAHVVSTRHGVVHEAGRQQLTGVLLVDHLFHQNLADTLRDTAVNLPGQCQGIDDGADVVDDEVRSSFTAPVSGSTSTSQTWQPFG